MQKQTSTKQWKMLTELWQKEGDGNTVHMRVYDHPGDKFCLCLQEIIWIS